MKSVFISLKYPSIFLKALYLTKSYFEFSNQQILNTQIILAVDYWLINLINQIDRHLDYT